MATICQLGGGQNRQRRLTCACLADNRAIDATEQDGNTHSQKIRDYVTGGHCKHPGKVEHVFKTKAPTVIEPGGYVEFRIQCTMTTHKAQGDVKLRITDACQGHRSATCFDDGSSRASRLCNNNTVEFLRQYLRCNVMLLNGS